MKSASAKPLLLLVVGVNANVNPDRYFRAAIEHLDFATSAEGEKSE